MRVIKSSDLISLSMKRCVIFVVLGFGFFSSHLALAHKGAMGVVKERMDLMDQIGKDMKSLKKIVNNKKRFAPDQIELHAESMAKASRHILKLFPEGSLQQPTESLASIWEDWERFSRLTETLTLESEKLKQSASSGNRPQVIQQFRTVAKTCRSCHTDFRKKKENR